MAATISFLAFLIFTETNEKKNRNTSRDHHRKGASNRHSVWLIEVLWILFMDKSTLYALNSTISISDNEINGRILCDFRPWSEGKQQLLPLSTF